MAKRKFNRRNRPSQMQSLHRKQRKLWAPDFRPFWLLISQNNHPFNATGMRSQRSIPVFIKASGTFFSTTCSLSSGASSGWNSSPGWPGQNNEVGVLEMWRTWTIAHVLPAKRREGRDILLCRRVVPLTGVCAGHATLHVNEDKCGRHTFAIISDYADLLVQKYVMLYRKNRC